MRYKVREWGIVNDQMYINEQWFDTLDEAVAFGNQTPSGTQADIHDENHEFIQTIKN